MELSRTMELSLFAVATLGFIDLCVAAEWMCANRAKTATILLILIGSCAAAGFLWANDQQLLTVCLVSTIFLVPTLRLSKLLEHEGKGRKKVNTETKLLLGFLAGPSFIMILMIWVGYLFTGFGQS